LFLFVAAVVNVGLQNTSLLLSWLASVTVEAMAATDGTTTSNPRLHFVLTAVSTMRPHPELLFDII
jgi:hypothetical protein